LYQFARPNHLEDRHELCQSNETIYITSFHGTSPISQNFGASPEELQAQKAAQQADPNVIIPNGPFLRVYFPTLPMAGQLHLRKLWESCTKRVTESAHVGVGQQLNPRTVCHFLNVG
jgi:hypothetical protein